MIYTLAVDQKMANCWYPLAPHHNVLMMDDPGKISGNIAIPKTVIATQSNWFNSPVRRPVTDEMRQRFEALPWLY